MAGNTSWTEFATSTFNDHPGEVADNVFKGMPLYKNLFEKGRVTKEGGNKIIRPLLYGENDTVTSFNGYDTFTVRPQTGISAAEFSWKEVVGTVMISQREMALNSGKYQAVNLLKEKKKQLEKSLRKKFNAYFLSDGTGNSGKDLLGLKALIGNNNEGPATVGGINCTTTGNEFWRSYVDRNSGTARAFDLDVWKRAYHESSAGTGEYPDLIFTTLDLYLAYEATQHPMLRYKSGDETANGLFVGLELGAATLFWDAQLVHDNVAGSPTYFINTDYIELVTHSDHWFTMTEFQQQPDRAAITAAMFCMGELVTNNRRMHGLVTNQTV